MTDQEEKEPRKISDIIVSLEDKVNSLLKVVAVYDMNLKNVLDRVNKIYKYISELEKQAEADMKNMQENKEPAIVSSPEIFIDEEREIVAQRKTSRVATPIELPVKEKKTAQQMGPEKKVSVLQRVTDHTGKDLFMADVTIMNENKEVILKAKTNAAGKWQAQLRPGNYITHIVKTDSATKKKVEAMQNLTVADTNAPMMLPVVIIKR